MSELAIAVFAAETDAHLLDAPRTARFASFCARFDEDAYLRALDAAGLRWIARHDLPARLHAIHDPPPGLFVRGSAGLDLLTRPAVAVVGARACSPYGTEVATSLARELARAGVLVVSGLARGVDAAAHRGALDAGVTIAVLGCGIDRDYPRAHAQLAAQIARAGLILSEYPPGVEPAPWRFPARNRRTLAAMPLSLNHAGRRCRTGRQLRRWCGLGVVSELSGDRAIGLVGVPACIRAPRVELVPERLRPTDG